jgi:hypothetical protein
MRNRFDTKSLKKTCQCESYLPLAMRWNFGGRVGDSLWNIFLMKRVRHVVWGRGWHAFMNRIAKKTIMRSLLYLIAVVLVIAWLIGFFAYGAAGLIHVLLVIAVLSILIGLFQSDRQT